MTSKAAVWIDLENAPHVWVLSPVVEHLQEMGYPVVLTARDFSCTVGLSRRRGYDVRVVGRSGQGKSKIGKTGRVLERTLALAFEVWSSRKSIRLALSHGSRSQILAARYLGIPVVSLDDYEFSDQSLVRFVDRLLVPFPISRETWGRFSSRVVHYPGLKEELYLCRFNPHTNGFAPGVKSDQVKVLFRPEGRYAHYRSAQSEVLQRAILDHLAEFRKVFLVLLLRDGEQAKALTRQCERLEIPHWVPQGVLDGPNLIWEMDAMLSGGGTMTREAAVLGVPSYSFFAGQWGAVDRHLQAKGRLVRLSSVRDVEKVVLRKREAAAVSVSSGALEFVTRFVDECVAAETGVTSC